MFTIVMMSIAFAGGVYLGVEFRDQIREQWAKLMGR